MKINSKLVLIILLVSSIYVNAAEVRDEFSVRVNDRSSFNIRYRADLADDGYLKNVKILVKNILVGKGSISRFFAGPGKLITTIEGNDLVLNFVNLNGSRQKAMVREKSIGTLGDCYRLTEIYDLCVKQNSGILGGGGSGSEGGGGGSIEDGDSGFGSSNLAHLIVLDKRTGATSRRLERAVINQKFALYYFPNKYEFINAEPIESIRLVEIGGKKLVEISGRYGVYRESWPNADSVNLNPTTEYLDYSKFNLLFL